MIKKKKHYSKTITNYTTVVEEPNESKATAMMKMLCKVDDDQRANRRADVDRRQHKHQVSVRSIEQRRERSRKLQKKKTCEILSKREKIKLKSAVKRYSKKGD